MIRSAAVKLMGELPSQSWPTCVCSFPLSFYFESCPSVKLVWQRKTGLEEVGRNVLLGLWYYLFFHKWKSIVSSNSPTFSHCPPHTHTPDSSHKSPRLSPASKSLVFIFLESGFLAWYHIINTLLCLVPFCEPHAASSSWAHEQHDRREIHIRRGALDTVGLPRTFHFPVSPPCQVHEIEK